MTSETTPGVHTQLWNVSQAKLNSILTVPILVFFLNFLIFAFMCIGVCLYVFLCTDIAFRVQKIPLGLELQMTLSHHVGVGV